MKLSKMLSYTRVDFNVSAISVNSVTVYFTACYKNKANR
jgi:hypothetical protein